MILHSWLACQRLARRTVSQQLVCEHLHGSLWCKDFSRKWGCNSGLELAILGAQVCQILCFTRSLAHAHQSTHFLARNLGLMVPQGSASATVAMASIWILGKVENNMQKAEVNLAVPSLGPLLIYASRDSRAMLRCLQISGSCARLFLYLPFWSPLFRNLCGFFCNSGRQQKHRSY